MNSYRPEGKARPGLPGGEHLRRGYALQRAAAVGQGPGAALGIPFGPAAGPTSAPYRLARRGAHQPLAPAPGLRGETVLQQPSGLAVHLLTFAAASNGRPPFETKQPELLLVLDGALELQLGQDTHTLQQGDAILLTVQPVTGWRNPAREPARVLWLLLEP